MVSEANELAWIIAKACMAESDGEGLTLLEAAVKMDAAPQARADQLLAALDKERAESVPERKCVYIVALAEHIMDKLGNKEPPRVPGAETDVLSYVLGQSQGIKASWKTAHNHPCLKLCGAFYRPGELWARGERNRRYERREIWGGSGWVPWRPSAT